MGVLCVYDDDFFEGLDVVSSHPEGEDVEVNVGECVSNIAYSPFSKKSVPVWSFEEVKGWIASHGKNQNQP